MKEILNLQNVMKHEKRLCTYKKYHFKCYNLKSSLRTSAQIENPKHFKSIIFKAIVELSSKRRLCIKICAKVLRFT